MKPLVAVLCLCLAAPALASEPVDLEAGQVAPFKGALCDADCAENIRRKRVACEDERDQLAKALTERPPESGGVWLAAGLGVVVGVVVGLLVRAQTSK